MADPVEQNTSSRRESNEATSLESATADQAKGPGSAFRETRADLAEKTSELADDAKEALVEKAEDVKQGMSGNLKALGGALRAAGNHLSENGQRATSKLMDEAGSGVERFADSLENKPFQEVFEELRTLGRNNAGGLFAAAVLAGVGLGRLMRSTEPENAGGSAPDQAASGSGDVQEPTDGEPQPSTQPPAPTATSGYAS